MLHMKYNCCAIHDVMGTTNDFDNTPWCTTSGSCEATASQIPKTCCKDVTLANYTSAHSSCHASVNPETYKLVICASNVSIFISFQMKIISNDARFTII